MRGPEPDESLFMLPVPPPSSEQSQWWAPEGEDDGLAEIAKLEATGESGATGSNPWAEEEGRDPLGASKH